MFKMNIPSLRSYATKSILCPTINPFLFREETFPCNIYRVDSMDSVFLLPHGVVG